MDRYCNNTWTRIVQLLNSDDIQGMDEQKCLALQKKYGLNKTDIPNTNKPYMKILDGFKEKSTIVYIIVMIMLFFLKNYIAAFIVMAVCIINFVVLIVHNVNRDKGIHELASLDKGEAIVIRNGVQKTINSNQVVIGDIVKFASGVIIPADIRIIEADNVMVDESIITGQAGHVDKFSDTIIGSVNKLSEMKNILFKGTEIKSGNGTGVVIATGQSSQLGKQLSMMIYSSNRKHSLGIMVNDSLGKYLLSYLGIVFIFFAYSFVADSDIVRTNAATALIALGCCPSIVIELISVKRIIKKFKDENIHINNFSVFNLIKDVNILFLDKIGSITKHDMEVKKIYINNDIISTEDPYVKEITFDRIIDISLICNNAVYNGQDNSTGALDEIAFLKYASRKKIYKSSVDSKNRKIIEIPCDSDKKFSTVVTKINRGCRANARGNVEEILNICTHFMINGVERELTEAVRNEIKKIDMRFSIEGLITEGFAYRNFNYEPSKSENIESNMVFVGIIGLENSQEDDLNITINKIRDKSLLPIIFTEENKLSAMTNIGKTGLIKSKDQVVAGIELDSLNQSELKELLCRARVFCRVTPEIKSKIISLFIKDGHKVVSTGEVLGDLPALNLSNVGIAKEKASNVVKKISDVYVEKNYLDGFFKIRNFSKILDKNIDRIFKIYFMTILSEILVLFINSIMGQTSSLDIWGAVSINGLLFIPLTLIVMNTKGRDISMNAMIFRSIILSVITCIISYGSEGKEASIISLIVLSLGTIIFTMFNSRVSIKKRSSELIMCLISIGIISLCSGMMIYINGIMIRDIVAIELIFSGVFLLIFEILCGKWQNSLMR